MENKIEKRQCAHITHLVLALFFFLNDLIDLIITVNKMVMPQFIYSVMYIVLLVWIAVLSGVFFLFFSMKKKTLSLFWFPSAVACIPLIYLCVVWVQFVPSIVTRKIKSKPMIHRMQTFNGTVVNDSKRGPSKKNYPLKSKEWQRLKRDRRRGRGGAMEVADICWKGVCRE